MFHFLREKNSSLENKMLDKKMNDVYNRIYKAKDEDGNAKHFF